MIRLGPVLKDAVLPIPPAIFVIDDEAGAGIDGCCAPDAASKIGTYYLITGASIDGCCAPDTTSNYWIKFDLLGPVLMDVVLPIPPVTLDHIV